MIPKSNLTQLTQSIWILQTKIVLIKNPQNRKSSPLIQKDQPVSQKTAMSDSNCRYKLVQWSQGIFIAKKGDIVIEVIYKH